jgi:hypothetical protein
MATTFRNHSRAPSGPVGAVIRPVSEPRRANDARVSPDRRASDQAASDDHIVTVIAIASRLLTPGRPVLRPAANTALGEIVASWADRVVSPTRIALQGDPMLGVAAGQEGGLELGERARIVERSP